MNRLLLTATVLLATLGSPASPLLAQTNARRGTAAALPVLTVDKQVALVPKSASPSSAIDPRKLSVVFDGRPQEVMGVGPLRKWRFVIYADPALSTPDGITGSTEALIEAVPLLVERGSVEIIVADPFTETYLEASENAGDVEAALEELETLADIAGEILALRDELIDGQEGSEFDSQSRLLALQEEAELLQESRLELLRWMSGETLQGPTCLILIQDGFDLGAAFAEQNSLDSGGVFAETLAHITEAHGRLAATLAGAGWTVVPMGLETASSDLLPGRSKTLGFLADSTGGVLVTRSDQLGGILQQLGEALVVTARVRSIPDGLPRLLEIKASGGDLPFHTPQWASHGTPIALSEVRTLQTLEEADLLVGPLSTVGIIRPDTQAPPQPDGFPGVLEAMTDLQRVDTEDPVFRISLLLFQIDGPPQTVHDLVAPDDLAGAAPDAPRRVSASHRNGHAGHR